MSNINLSTTQEYEVYDCKHVLDSVMLLVKLRSKGIAKTFAINAKKPQPQIYIGKDWKLPSEFLMKYQNFSVKIFRRSCTSPISFSPHTISPTTICPTEKKKKKILAK